MSGLGRIPMALSGVISTTDSCVASYIYSSSYLLLLYFTSPLPYPIFLASMLVGALPSSHQYLTMLL